MVHYLRDQGKSHVVMFRRVAKSGGLRCPFVKRLCSLCQPELHLKGKQRPGLYSRRLAPAQSVSEMAEKKSSIGQE